MSALREIQEQFLDAIYNDDETILSQIEPGGLINPEQRLQIYKNSVRMILTESLRKTFPTIEKLVSREFFNFTADQYLRAHPLTQGNMDDYGVEFPDFIARFEPASAHPYLSDIACYEWRKDHLISSTYDDPLSPETLSKVNEETMQGLFFIPRDNVMLFQSDYPAPHIVEMIKTDRENDIDMGTGPQQGILLRDKNNQINFIPCSNNAFKLAEALTNNQSLLNTAEDLIGNDPDFDLQSGLAEVIALEIFKTIEVKHDKETV